MKGNFDHAAFFAALDAKRSARRMTWKQVAEETGVSASTLTRMAQGRRPDVDGLAALLRWSGLQAEAFIGGAETKSEPLSEMTAVIYADQRLSAQNKSVLEHMLRAAYEKLRDD
jgi:transcriptional regulator with XRE-family HTH domain